MALKGALWSVRFLICPPSKVAFNTVFSQFDAQQSPAESQPEPQPEPQPEREAIQFVSNAWNNVRVAVAALGGGELKKCWSEGKDDEAKMHACLAKAISTWLAVLESEEGLNCLLAAKHNNGKLSACKANGATAQVIYLKVYELQMSAKILNFNLGYLWPFN